jgi:rhodanese-related sulfurtransferase
MVPEKVRRKTRTMATPSIAHGIAAAFPARRSAADVRADFLARREIALLDVREEAHHAEGHPLFAANLPFSRLEFEAHARIPRRNTPIVLLDNGEGLATLAAERLLALGYQNVALLEDGLQGWCDAGYEVFRDVNSPSKAFGELVEAQRHTPLLSAEEVKALIDTQADAVIVDARRFDEFQTMSIPTATSVPGAELVLRVRGLAPRPETRVIVNCAGRTRSIIGAQSLINAGLPNPVAALRNGTIGWKLAGQTLDHGQSHRFPEVDDTIRKTSAAAARQVADRAGVKRVDLNTLIHWTEDSSRTVYRFDVRTPEEFVAGHLPGFRNAPGGQLVQETDGFAPVRGARIVLVDDDGTRANMTASWLAQMAWDVFVIDSGVGEPDGLRARFTEGGRGDTPLPALPPLPDGAAVSPSRLAEWLQPGSDSAVVVFDFAPSSNYAKSHIPGSWFALRSSLSDALNAPVCAGRYVFISPDGVAARFAWADARTFTTKPLHVLDGGTAAWTAQGGATDDGAPRYASPPIDRYKRPYEGTDSPAAAMQAYLDWEYGLVEQLNRDGTHGFRVL